MVIAVTRITEPTRVLRRPNVRASLCVKTVPQPIIRYIMPLPVLRSATEIPVSSSIKTYAGDNPDIMAPVKKHQAMAVTRVIVFRFLPHLRGSLGSSVG